ncbi:hypothetical protein Pta02_23230 [Planobispora takensis]|uniref:Uncharacterized protein n=1 Tax=Planobispora takensis TaxID=1367882 RepID=A0A8J3SXV5_9ACTN|nr:hypothetical protein Pta02_23230 [Planobispora takensis]
MPCRLWFNIPDPSQVVARIDGRWHRRPVPDSVVCDGMDRQRFWERSHEEWTMGNQAVNMPKLNRYI